MAEPYYGLLEGGFVGSVTFGGRRVEATLDLKLVDKLTASFAVQAGDSSFSMIFTWHWWEETRQADIAVTEVEIGGRKIPSRCVGKLVGGKLTLTVTCAEAIGMFGVTDTVLRVDAGQAN